MNVPGWFTAELGRLGRQVLAEDISRQEAATRLEDLAFKRENRIFLHDLVLDRTATWCELFPAGRDIFYEGDDPAGFIQTIKAEFGFDPSADPRWGQWIEWGDDSAGQGEAGFMSYRFRCPPQHLDAIYGSPRFRMGS